MAGVRDPQPGDYPFERQIGYIGGLFTVGAIGGGIAWMVADLRHPGKYRWDWWAFVGGALTAVAGATWILSQAGLY